MQVKLIENLPQSADRRNEFQTGIENELRKRLVLLGTAGIVSGDGADVDDDNAALALSVNSVNTTAVDVAGGTVVFPNGEFVDVSSTDIQNYQLDTSETDAIVLRLEYGEVAAGDNVTNTYHAFAAQPKIIKKTPLEMLVVESITAYNAQPADVLARSVVIGVARFSSSILTVDNGRDTYSFSRPWSSPVDAEHRSMVGTGLKTSTNPHATSLSDLTVGAYTAWQALVGPPAAVISRANGVGKYPGEVCTETILSGSFVSDATGLVTGIAGSFYAPLGRWPDRLLKATLSGSTTRLAAWIPKGRKVIAISDPVNFAAAANVEIYYSYVTAGSFPGSIAGLSEFSVSAPTTNELISAGGNLHSAFAESKVIFTDVGTIPMKFDVMVDSDAKVYKNPDPIYCNTALDTLGATPASFTIQPKVASRLRFGISNYLQGFTEITFLVSGTDESGATISETVTFTGPAPSPVQTSFQEQIFQRRFTANIFASVTQVQVVTRNGDGPNTTLTVFAEYSPDRPGQQDDLILGTVQWTGSEVNDIYANDPDVALDRRPVSLGGAEFGMTPAESQLNLPMIADSVLGSVPAGVTAWATIAEDFNHPQFMEYPNDYDTVQTNEAPVELTTSTIGARHGYISRLIPLPSLDASSMDAMWLRMLPRSMRSFPSRQSNNFQVTVDMYHAGGVDTYTGTLGTNPYPPYQVSLAGPAVAAQVYYGMRVSMHLAGAAPRDFNEAFQGFLFHARS